MAVISIHLTSAVLLVLWAAWIQENARGQILLQHLEAPRIAGPKKTLGNSDFTAPRYQQYHHWVQRWTQTTLTWNDIRWDLKIPIAWNRARYENFSKLARKSPSKKVTQLLLWDTSCFLLNIQTWFLKKWKNNCTSERLHLQKVLLLTIALAPCDFLPQSSAFV